MGYARAMMLDSVPDPVKVATGGDLYSALTSEGRHLYEKIFVGGCYVLASAIAEWTSPGCDPYPSLQLV